MDRFFRVGFFEDPFVVLVSALCSVVVVVCFVDLVLGLLVCFGFARGLFGLNVFPSVGFVEFFEPVIPSAKTEFTSFSNSFGFCSSFDFPSFAFASLSRFLVVGGGSSMRNDPSFTPGSSI